MFQAAIALQICQKWHSFALFPVTDLVVYSNAFAPAQVKSMHAERSSSFTPDVSPARETRPSHPSINSRTVLSVRAPYARETVNARSVQHRLW